MAIGVHPHAAHEFADDPARAAAVVRAQCARTPVGAGRGRDRPRLSLRLLATRRAAAGLPRAGAAGARAALPVVIHTREADDDTLAILEEEGGGELRGVLHCFTGTAALARAGLDLGFYISVAGIVTFPKAHELRDTVKNVPLDRLLTETDSPFLAPVPHRGKRNEPAFVVEVVEVLAAVHGVSPAVTGRGNGREFRGADGAVTASDVAESGANTSPKHSFRTNYAPPRVDTLDNLWSD